MYISTTFIANVRQFWMIRSKCRYSCWSVTWNIFLLFKLQTDVDLMQFNAPWSYNNIKHNFKFNLGTRLIFFMRHITNSMLYFRETALKKHQRPSNYHSSCVDVLTDECLCKFWSWIHVIKIMNQIGLPNISIMNDR